MYLKGTKNVSKETENVPKKTRILMKLGLHVNIDLQVIRSTVDNISIDY